MRRFAWTFVVVGLLALLAGGAQASTITLSDVASTEGQDPDELKAQFDFAIVGGDLELTVTNTDDGTFNFNINEIYFNSTDGTGVLDFLSAVDESNVDRTTEWDPLLLDTMVNGFGDFQFGLADGQGENSVGMIMPGETWVFTFDIVSGYGGDPQMQDFVAENENGYLAAAKFVNGNSPDNDDSSFGAAIPEPGAMALFSTALIVAGALSRRRTH